MLRRKAQGDDDGFRSGIACRSDISLDFAEVAAKLFFSCAIRNSYARLRASWKAHRCAIVPPQSGRRQLTLPGGAEGLAPGGLASLSGERCNATWRRYIAPVRMGGRFSRRVRL